MTLRQTLAHHASQLTLQPPWYVRLLGAAFLVGDIAMWLGEASPTSVLELGKHGLILAIGMAFFWPEGLRLVVNTARRFPLFDRRSSPRPPSGS